MKYFIVVFLFIFSFAKADNILPFQAGQGFDEKYLWGEANSDKKNGSSLKKFSEINFLLNY